MVCPMTKAYLISIHALLAEIDPVPTTPRTVAPSDFYPRSPRGDRRRSHDPADEPKKFLSTLSSRRSTIPIKHFFRFGFISIHALLAEIDLWPFFLFALQLYFYPRSPRGDRRQTPCKRRYGSSISIHALLAEIDAAGLLCAISYRFISIHALLAEIDTWGRVDVGTLDGFLSTLSSRRSTESTLRTWETSANFYPRSPRGDRQQNATKKSVLFVVKLAILPLPYAIFRDLSKFFRHFIHFERHFLVRRLLGFDVLFILALE